MEWLPLPIIATVALLLSSAPAQAAQAEPQPYSLAIIVGGGRSEDDAKKAINEFKGVDWGKVTPAEGYPKIISSDDVPGAPPNTYIAVIGYCEGQKSDALVKKMIRAISVGAYSMAVVGKFENACPTLAPELLKSGAEAPPAKKKEGRAGY